MQKYLLGIFRFLTHNDEQLVLEIVAFKQTRL